MVDAREGVLDEGDEGVRQRGTAVRAACGRLSMDARMISAAYPPTLRLKAITRRDPPLCATYATWERRVEADGRALVAQSGVCRGASLTW